MSMRNRVIWREGLFIKPQHFQQQQRHIDYTLHARLSAVSDNYYGLLSLAINEEYLNFGRIALVSATGVMPDGTVFNIPGDDALPPPLEITDASVSNQKVYLAIPLAVSGVNEVSQQGQHIATRLEAHRYDVRDLHSEGGDVVSLEVGRTSLRLMLEREDRSAYASMAIACILDKRPDGGLVLDPAFMPCSASVAAIPVLKRFLGESAGLVAERARSLSQRIAAPGQQGVAAWLAHRHAQRELVRGGYVDQPGAIGDLLHAQAFIIHRHGLQVCAQGQEQLPCRRVAGVFHGHLATWLDQHPGDQVQCLLGAVAHQ